jgi:hypothetical protein
MIKRSLKQTRQEANTSKLPKAESETPDSSPIKPKRKNTSNEDKQRVPKFR